MKTLLIAVIAALVPACIAEDDCPDHAPACAFVAVPDQCTKNGEPIDCPDEEEQASACSYGPDGVLVCE